LAPVEIVLILEPTGAAAVPAWLSALLLDFCTHRARHAEILAGRKRPYPAI